MIQDTKPYVRFGISTFGIWTTNASVAQQEGIILPTGITGANTYESIYCDPVAWLKEGTVDYISPQLYWPTYQTAQSYDVLRWVAKSLVKAELCRRVLVQVRND